MAYHIYKYILVSVFPKLKRETYTFRSNGHQSVRTPGDIIYSHDRFLETLYARQIGTRRLAQSSGTEIVPL